jgi:hypothetical protein
MAYDPVLDREMFRPKSKSKGVEDLRESEDPAVVARREQALAMMAAAKEKFDPANYQTLKEQDRPGVFRPVAVNMPAQQQTADTAMRMQQMANMGMRPIGMAEGGDPADKIKPTIESPGVFERISRFMYPDGPQTMAVGPKAKYSLPDVGLRIGREDQPAIVDEFQTNYVRPEFMAEPLSDEERAALEELKNRYGPEAAQKIFDEQQARYTDGGSRLTRGIRDLLDNPPSKSEIEQTIKTLKEQEETAPRPDVEQRMYERRLADIEEQRRAARRAREENPVPGVFESSTREEVARAQAQQEAAVRKAVADVGGSVPTRSEYQGGPLSGAATTSGMGLTSLPATQSAEDKVAASRVEGNLQYGAKAPTPAVTRAASSERDYSTSMTDIKRDREDAFNMALMQAGLAMMAGKSSNALANIGEGGIAGLQAYASQLGQARARDIEDRKLSMMEKYYGSREKAAGIAAAKLQQDYLEALSNARSKAEGKWIDTVKNDPTLSMLQSKDPAAFNARKKLFINDQLQDFTDQFKTQVSIARNASPDPELTKDFEQFQ